MNSHPGGLVHTKQLLSLSALLPPAHILDMGAGRGDAVRYLHSLGYQAEGIDLAPQTVSNLSASVLQGNFLYPPYAEGTFDGIISQCAFYVSGSPSDALAVAYRLLKSDGILMLSDVCPREITLKTLAEAAGFFVSHYEDQTPAWKEYYIESIWQGTACSFPTDIKMNYEMLICKK